MWTTIQSQQNQINPIFCQLATGQCLHAVHSITLKVIMSKHSFSQFKTRQSFQSAQWLGIEEIKR